ncbi:hypothetical protein UPYG_G00007700 [Umbra pygmaea]|uniref:Uncharacterized protein n=1 Tax=Umbra pygmaea TaxID=75934 RepID=A0ABD0XHU7_UMBPY
MTDFKEHPRSVAKDNNILLVKMGSNYSSTKATKAPTTVKATTTTTAPTVIASTVTTAPTVMPTTSFLDQLPTAEQIIIATCICLLITVVLGLFVYLLKKKNSLACDSKAKHLNYETNIGHISQMIGFANEHKNVNAEASKAQLMDDCVIYSDLIILTANTKPIPATDNTEYACVRIWTSEDLDAN